MAVQEALISVTIPAGADLRTHQFKFVSVNSDGNVVLTANNALAHGVLQNAPNTGEAATVAISGIVKVKCDGVVTRGGQVSSAANGLAKNPTTNSSRLGVALATGAANAVIPVLFHPIGA
jgi:hypothetical protein